MKYNYIKPELLFHGTRVDLLSVEVERPKGGFIRREVVAHPGAVVILAMPDPEHIVMIKNERYAVQEILWELPAGTLEGDEIPDACAERELQEETGYKANKISFLCEFFTSPGFCNEKIYCYFAKELIFFGQKLDENEKIEVETIELKRALKMIEEGIIRDAKTICSLFYFKNYRDQKQ